MGVLKKKILISSVIAALTTFLVVNASVAWFSRTNKIDTDLPNEGISGSVLTSYFHTDENYVGDGTPEKPFVITRPVHYENLIWLHNNVPNFYKANRQEDTLDGKGFYFEIGHNLDGSGTKKVYAYDDNGKPIFNGDQPTYSTELNLSCFSQPKKELIPLGSPQYPFIGELNGNNIKVSGFKVVSVDKTHNNNALEDIGIFGYVGPSGYVHNVYYSDYTINTDGAKVHDETSYTLHTPHKQHPEDPSKDDFPYPCIGSLAGHIMVAESFSNVYVNDCTIEGTGGDAEKKLDNYSYYGVVEKPTGGGTIGKGNNYDFTLSSAAVWKYMSQNWNTIQGNPMRNRNTEYAGNYPVPEFDGNNNAINPFKKGISYVRSGIPSYNLVGDDPDDYSSTNPYTGLNYSLSTLGYAPLTADSKSYRYKVVTEAGETPSKDMVLSTESLDVAKATPRTINEIRRYYNSSEKQWEYYTVNTYDRGPIPLKIHMSCNSTFVYEDSGYWDPTDYWSSYTRAYLFIDGIKVGEYTSEDFNTFTITTEPYSTILGTRYRNPTYTIDFDKTIDVNLSMGTHHIAFLIKCSCGNGQYASAVFYDNNSKISISSAVSIPANRVTITQGSLPITTSTLDNSTIDISIDPSAKHEILGTSRRIENDRVITSGGTWDESKRDFIDRGSSEKSEILVGYDLNNPSDTQTYPLSSDGFKFEYDDGKQLKRFKILYDDDGNIQYNPETNLPYGVDDEFNIITPTDESEVEYEDGVPIAINKVVQDHEAMWVATMETQKTIATHTIVDEDHNHICDVCNQPYSDGETSHEDAPIYPADDPILTDAGYNAKNIDVVGGGFQFSNGFITVDGEENRALTSPITASDIGKPFYATKYGANSIVLYLANVGGQNETDEMGNIEFDYTWSVSGGFIHTNFKSMVFKKGGSGGYVYFGNNLAMETGDYSEVSRGLLSTTVKMKLRRGIVKKCAYCALDKDGNILCGYDANGNQVGYTGSISLAQIDRYVLFVGVKNNIPRLNINTRIEEIRFSYKAPSGFGGNFGSVEYRNQGQTVENTVLNFYFLIPENDKFRVKVTYSGPNNPTVANRGRYDITFDYYSESNEYIEVICYLYNIDLYQVYLNGTRVSQTGTETVKVYSQIYT